MLTAVADDILYELSEVNRHFKTHGDSPKFVEKLRNLIKLQVSARQLSK